MVVSQKKSIKKRQGLVVSTDKFGTAVILVSNVRKSRLYDKSFTISKKIKAHNENNKFKVDDLVEIVESRPISKDKHFKIFRKVEK